MHAFKDKFTLAEHMRSRHAASLTDAAFRTWWAELQAALTLPDGARESAFNELLGGLWVRVRVRVRGPCF